MHWPSVDVDAPLVRPDHSSDDLDQRRFPGTILAHQRVPPTSV